jgi:hypothetical protein
MSDVEDIKDRLNKLAIFEAVLFGIYGNWLISFVDKITTLFPDIRSALLVIFVILSFFFLLTLVSLSIFYPKKMTRLHVIFFGVMHFACNFGAFFVEGMAPQFAFFLSVGGVMLILICSTIYGRIQTIRHLEAIKNLASKLKT